MQPHFTTEAMTFLRGLKRHNDREWFEARREIYERSLRVPVLAVAEALNHAFAEFAPEHVRPANKAVMRIYRDTRFSKNKQPYKTHLSAWWSRRGMEKTSGGGFYLQIDPQQVMIAAGVYMPERDQLLALRRWMSANHTAYRKQLKKILGSRSLGFGGIDAAPLTRMPKGFLADDPADELVRATNWGVSATLPAGVALTPKFVAEIVKRMRTAAPLVDTLNDAILSATSRRTSNLNAMF